jgi:hypothetical protein
LGMKAAEEAERYLSFRDDHSLTPLHTLRSLAAALTPRPRQPPLSPIRRRRCPWTWTR